MAILLLFLIYFLLASGEMFKEKLVKLSGERLSQKKVTVQMIDEITAQIGRFVFYQFWSGLLVGVVDLAGLRVDGRALRGAVGRGGRRPQLHSVLRSDDHHGASVRGRGAAVPIARRWSALVALASLAITSLEGFLLAPIALGRAASVNSVAVFVAVMFWGWMWGPLGLILAVPMLMIVKTVADHVESLASISELLGDER